MPIIVFAHVAYITNNRAVGISKWERIVKAYGKWLQIQEQIRNQIGKTFIDVLKPKGVGVITEAQHQFMSTRGIKKKCIYENELHVWLH